MATRTRFEIKGLRELGEALKALGDETGSKIARAATAAAAGIIRKRARELAPVAPEPYTIEGVRVQPGNIGKNIVTKRVPAAKTRLTSEHVVAVRGKLKYGFASRVGALQEFGTVKMSPQPYLRPAFEQEKGFAVQAMRAKLKAGIDKANKAAK
jgi:HK97 gp10 family phage protein